MRTKRPTPALIVASLALIVALGGGAYAAFHLPKNSVLSKNIKNGQVQTQDLAADGKFHIVGEHGQPQFLDGGQGDCIWGAYHPGPPAGDAFNRPAFYKDKNGIVHLAGVAASADGSGGDASCAGADGFADGEAFVLPAAYRPPNVELFPAAGGNPGPFTAVAVIGPQGYATPSFTVPRGTVLVVGSGADDGGIGFDGIDFRAGGKGVGLSKASGTVQISERRLRSLLTMHAP